MNTTTLLRLFAPGILAFLIAMGGAAATHARSPQTDVPQQPDESQLVEHGHYTNKSRQWVHHPRTPKTVRHQPAQAQSAGTAPTASAALIAGPARDTVE